MSRTAFLFPGQGSQAPGMGCELNESCAASREVFRAADRALARPLSDLCFHGDAEALALTENTQPAILTVSVAVLRALEARGLHADAAAGHSLGEYSAHVAAGTLRFADAVQAVSSRGRFMQEAVPVGAGAMSAVIGLDAAQVERICETASNGERVSPANYNAPGQVVIAGHAAAVARASAASREAGALRVLPLAVSAPFHCELMQPAAEKLRPVLEAIDFQDPAVPVFTNVDAAPVREGAAARDALIRQVAAPVRWQQLIETMLDAGYDTFVEVGPGKVLAGLLRRIRKGTRGVSVADPAGVDRAVEELGG